jgi:hypothetical protein
MPTWSAKPTHVGMADRRRPSSEKGMWCSSWASRSRRSLHRKSSIASWRLIREGEDLEQIPRLGHSKRLTGVRLLAESGEVAGSPLVQDLLNAANHKSPRCSQEVGKLGGHHNSIHFDLLNGMQPREWPHLKAIISESNP